MMSESGNADSPEAEVSPCCTRGCCVKAFRVVATILLAPVALVVVVVAIVIWLLLLPLKCLCPCCSPCLTLVTETLLGLSKLVCKGLGLTCCVTNGAPDEEHEKGSIKEDKPDYGTASAEKEKHEQE